MNGNGLNTFLRSHAGIIAAFGLLAAGAFGALWLAGIIALPNAFKAHEQVPHLKLDEQIMELRNETRALRDSVAQDNWRLLYVICTQVPDATRQEKRLLRVDCDDLDYREPTMEVGQP